MFRAALDLVLPAVLATLLIAAAVAVAVADAPSRAGAATVPSGPPAR